MSVDDNYKLKTEIERLKVQVESLENLLYDACVACDGVLCIPVKVRAWYNANESRVLTKRFDDSRRSDAERVRDEAEYERLARKLGKVSQT